MNKHGEVIGILSTRETAAEGVVFALQARHIHKALNELTKRHHLPTNKIVVQVFSYWIRTTQQVKKVEDYVFMVKVN